MQYTHTGHSITHFQNPDSEMAAWQNILKLLDAGAELVTAVSCPKMTMIILREAGENPQVEGLAKTEEDK